MHQKKVKKIDIYKTQSLLIYYILCLFNTLKFNIYKYKCNLHRNQNTITYYNLVLDRANQHFLLSLLYKILPSLYCKANEHK